MLGKSSFSSKRRGFSGEIGAKIAKISRVAAPSLLAFAFWGTLGYETPTPAQTIINEIPQNNNRFQGFSVESTKKIAWLDAADAAPPTFRLDLPEPARPAREIDGLSVRIPFRFREGADRDASAAIELYFSDDGGATWRSFAKVGADDGGSAFSFEAPRPGEYRLALKTYFKSGKSAFSETRAFRFAAPGVEVATDSAPLGTAALPLPASKPTAPNDAVFALNDDSEIDSGSDLEPVGSPAGTKMENALGGDYSTRLLALARGEKAVEKSDRPTPASAETVAETSAPTVDESQVVPHPGKLKSISVAKDKKTDELLFVARWFRPDELDERYRGKPTTVALERSDSPNGPWTTIVDGLKSEEFGYYWAPGAEGTKPFYLRSVSTDSDGDVWVDALANPIDVVAARGVRAALGKTKTPIPPLPPTRSEVDGASDENSGKDVLIRNAAAEDAEDSPRGESDAESAANAPKSSPLKAGKRRAATESADSDFEPAQNTRRETTYSPPRPRPNIPAPTNPNEFQLNPLFTQGFGVLFQAAQTRADGGSDGKRSIFTPPSRAAAVASIPPAEYQSLVAARRRQEEKARDMSGFEKNPELMEGMVFYQDENGNLTRTPPADFQTASANGAFAEGGTFVGGMNADGIPLFLPPDNETYDASVNSGAATLTNAAYPNAATPSSSPLNGGYSNSSGYGAVPTNGGASLQPIPQTSFAPGGSHSPRPTATRSVFPPRPTVAN